MGDFSEDPKLKLDASLRKHYVGVRMQQGVPVLDADWNELEDLRRWELWSLIKWFVGNGVPEQNQGFKVEAIENGGVDTVVLVANNSLPGLSSLSINRTTSTAADILGFGDNNATVTVPGSAAARLGGDITGNFDLTDNLTLIVGADGGSEETVTFSSADALIPDITNVTATQVAAVINAQATRFSAAVGQGNNFSIRGGDGSAEGAGRCLVDGWEVRIETDMKYSSQALYLNDELANRLGVSRLEALTTPPTTTPPTRRTDTVYLDIWEREVVASEDADHLVNPQIGLETTARTAREWVVRVAENASDPPPPSSGHRHFKLASLVRDGMDIIDLDVRDTRSRTGLLDNLDLRQTELNNRVKILRNAIEHMVLSSQLPDMPPGQAVNLPNIVVEAYSSAGGFKQLVNRFNSNASYTPRYYFSPVNGFAQVQSQVLVDSQKPIRNILVTDKSHLFGPLEAETTVDVSLDGGANFGLTSQPLGSEMDTRELLPNGNRYQLVLRFNLPSVNASPSNIWSTRAPMPEPRSHLSVVAGNNQHLYTMGGNESASTSLISSNSVNEYDPEMNSWTGRASMIRSRHLLGAAALRSQRIYAIGGVDSSSLVAEVEHYDMLSDVWTTSSANLPTPRLQPAVVTTSDETIYTICGATSTQVNINEVLDPFTETWSVRAAAPTARQFAIGSVTNEDEILLYGGVAGTSVLGILESYNPATNSWTTRGSMAAPRAAHAGAAVSNDYMYALGGFEVLAGQPPTNTNQEYDPNTDTWVTRANIPGDRNYAVAATVHNHVHFMGGWDSTRTTQDTHLQYQPLLTTKIRQSGFAVEYTFAE